MHTLLFLFLDLFFGYFDLRDADPDLGFSNSYRQHNWWHQKGLPWLKVPRECLGRKPSRRDGKLERSGRHIGKGEFPVWPRHYFLVRRCTFTSELNMRSNANRSRLIKDRSANETCLLRCCMAASVLAGRKVVRRRRTGCLQQPP
jgi:hypothetical protein